MRKSILKVSLGESTANIIRERMIRGEYPAGSKIREDELAAEFEISRICVREAMLILDREGLLDKKPNKTSCVRTYTAKEVRDLLSYRTLLETAAALGAMEQGTVPEKELEQCLEIMGKLHDEEISTEAYLEADIVFHDTLIGGLQNEYVNISWDAIRSQYLMLMYALYKVRSVEFHDGYEMHVKMLEYMKSGEKEKLKELIHSSIMSNCDSISQFVCVES